VSVFEIILISIGLAMDAFGVSIGKGLTMPVGENGRKMICTHFPGHILFTSLNTWMLPCILQGASILFFSESFYYCNS